MGLVFPILMPLFYRSPHVIDYSRTMLSYIGSYLGVLFSPTHLCMAVTKEYFGVPFRDIYRHLTPILLTVIAASIILFALSFPPDYIIK